MMNFHIFAPDTIRLPKWATHERLCDCPAGQRVYTDCCYCWMRADETTVQIITSPPIPHGMEHGDMMDLISANGAYYMDSIQVIECGDGFGCNANPRRKIGMHLRARA